MKNYDRGFEPGLKSSDRLRGEGYLWNENEYLPILGQTVRHPAQVKFGFTTARNALKERRSCLRHVESC